MTEKKPYWDADDDAPVDESIALQRPSESPLRAFAGSARREKPTVELDVPRWKAHVKVVPIVGAGPRTMFDVVASWTGPGLPELGVQRQAVDAETSYMVREDDHELAESIARATASLLGAGEVPFIDDVAAAIRDGREGWLGRYRQVVGDAGKAAAEGF